jgi:hypothetical protein
MKSSSRFGNVRTRQWLLTAALAAPLVVAIAAAPPFVAEPRAQGAAGMIGPVYPIMAGGDRISPQRSGNTITFPTRWSACGDPALHTVTLSNPDGSGRYRTMRRMLGDIEQTLTITSFFGSGAPREGVLTETRGGSTISTTTMTLVDVNSDGVVDAATFSGLYNTTISFVRQGDHLSIPWSQVNSIGIYTSYPCGGELPPVWAPLADTNSDGRGDSLVLDLDGNGVADADLFAGPAMVLPSVPTMGAIARLIMLALVGSICAWFLTRRQLPRAI